MNNIKAAVLTLGCRVNQYESDFIIKELEKYGVEICPFSDVCHIYIINTCSVTGESDRKSRQMIRRAVKTNPQAKVIVTGCYSQINPEEAGKIPGVSYVCGSNLKSQIPKIAMELLSKDQPCVVNVPSIFEGGFDTMCVGASHTRTRAFVKIEDGCDSRCAYCIIPYTRGNVRSSLPENVISEVKAIASEGCAEVVLTGIETAAYGKDLKNGYTLADLIVEVGKIDGIERIRLGSLDPASITKEFVDKVKTVKSLMPHFHISMQSGNTKTLNAMRRKYNIDMAKRNIDYLKESIDNLMLSADVITGFPGESDEDFEKTLEFFKENRFLHLHVFPYSKRKGTPACDMENQVDEGIKRQRLHLLEKQQREIKLQLLLEYVEKNPVVPVLFESYNGGSAQGHSPSFVDICVKSSRSLGGQIHNVKLTHTDGSLVFGELI
ncbi:MAG: tRNA (N(6)-L-threonylcarbamoyladenosine(37)-C(2))-methylthiotransferase MtaB [Clostridia bacterium]|nr:tRNA (N(6)-L-threonylcarbamoyladenosine(37)-C(2))-methylthiotransferase MtaB [Clostridia bacterium]